MFVHHVFFWMNPDATTADRVELAAGLESLRSIQLIRQFHVGTPANTTREVIDRSYDFSLLMIFDNASDEQAYQQHPTHLEFIASCKHLWRKVLIYDAVDN